ncbi:hypothetical protein JL101_020210 [Skermanella rosea]|uniref:hypothetical protein n=1 Tax=Skermanella rosea TaxID=1817965 RepID=UPI0019337A5B|nr:hypothetical protein [Skermanella rosea]UEM02308.1 hypothetical protein JL101_020210 [Skermanella rosea]
MLTEATANIVTLLALIAIVHFAVTAVIARKLTRDELAEGGVKGVGSANFNGQPANDSVRKAA